MKDNKKGTIGDVTFQPQIEGLRGIAIVFILLCHFLGNAFSILWIGVDLFFVLSGFLITRILLSKVNAPGYFLNFYVRRTLRIFPLYYFALIVVLIVLPAVGDHDFDYLREKQTWFWLYLQNWLFVREGWPQGDSFIISHFWSLAIEEQYYLIWPFLVFAFRRNFTWLLNVSVGLVLVAIVLRLSGLFNDPGFYVSTITRMDSLLIGSVTAMLAMRSSALLEKFSFPLFLVTAIILVIALIVTKTSHYSNHFFATVGYSVLALFFASVLVLSYRESGWLYYFLDSRILKLFGRYSYGLYVFHFPVFYLLRPVLVTFMGGFLVPLVAKIVATLIILLVTISITLTSYHLLELPCLRLKKHFE